MATPSSMLPLGTALPPVRLTNAVDGTEVDVGKLAAGARGVFVAFICNHCPYVVHLRKELVRVAHEALDRGIAVVAINSNDPVTYPQDGPGPMGRLAKDEKWRFPFLFDAEGRLAYRGQFDDSRPSNGKPITGSDLRAAIEAVVAGQKPSANQKPSVGCNIKWRS